MARAGIRAKIRVRLRRRAKLPQARWFLMCGRYTQTQSIEQMVMRFQVQELGISFGFLDFCQMLEKACQLLLRPQRSYTRLMPAYISQNASMTSVELDF